jgi:hypothetical protein
LIRQRAKEKLMNSQFEIIEANESEESPSPDRKPEKLEDLKIEEIDKEIPLLLNLHKVDTAHFQKEGNEEVSKHLQDSLSIDPEEVDINRQTFGVESKNLETVPEVNNFASTVKEVNAFCLQASMNEKLKKNAISLGINKNEFYKTETIKKKILKANE